jgi:hypothetical protein
MSIQRASDQATWVKSLSEPTNLLSALKWGVIVGCSLALINQGLGWLTDLIQFAQSGNNNDSLGSILQYSVPACMSIFVACFSLYVAGYMTSSECRQIPPGVLSTFIAYLISYTLKVVFDLIAHRPFTLIQQPAPGTSILFTIIAALIALTIILGAVGGLGYLGAFYGIKRNRNKEIKVKA